MNHVFFHTRAPARGIMAWVMVVALLLLSICSPADAARQLQNEQRLSVPLQGFRVALTPLEGSTETLTNSEGDEIRDILDAAFESNLEEIFVNDKNADFRYASIAAVETILTSFSGKTYLYIEEGGYVEFEVSSRDALPAPSELQAILEQTITEDLAELLQQYSDFDFVLTVGYVYDPNPTAAPTMEPTRVPTTTDAPTTPSPTTKSPTMAPTDSPTEAPTTPRPTESPTQSPTLASASPTMSPTTLAPTTTAPTTMTVDSTDTAGATLAPSPSTAPPTAGSSESPSAKSPFRTITIETNKSNGSDDGSSSPIAAVGVATAGLAVAVLAVFLFVAKRKRRREQQYLADDSSMNNEFPAKFGYGGGGLREHDGMATASEAGSSGVGSLLRAVSGLLPIIHENEEFSHGGTSSDDTPDEQDLDGFATEQATEVQPKIVPLFGQGNHLVIDNLCDNDNGDDDDSLSPSEVTSSSTIIQEQAAKCCSPPSQQQQGNSPWPLSNYLPTFPFWATGPSPPISSPTDVSASALGEKDGFDEKWSDVDTSDAENGFGEDFGPDKSWDPDDNDENNDPARPFQYDDDDDAFRAPAADHEII